MSASLTHLFQSLKPRQSEYTVGRISINVHQLHVNLSLPAAIELAKKSAHQTLAGVTHNCTPCLTIPMHKKLHGLPLVFINN